MMAAQPKPWVRVLLCCDPTSPHRWQTSQKPVALHFAVAARGSWPNHRRRPARRQSVGGASAKRKLAYSRASWARRLPAAGVSATIEESLGRSAPRTKATHAAGCPSRPARPASCRAVRWRCGQLVDDTACSCVGGGHSALERSQLRGAAPASSCPGPWIAWNG